jgi:hypothetical protein
MARPKGGSVRNAMKGVPNELNIAVTTQRGAPWKPKSQRVQVRRPHGERTRLCSHGKETDNRLAERACREQPHFIGAVRVAAASYALAGRADEAQKCIARARQLHLHSRSGDRLNASSERPGAHTIQNKIKKARREFAGLRI